MSIDSNIAILCITEKGKNLAIEIKDKLGDGDVYYIKNKPEDINLELDKNLNITIIKNRVKTFVEEIFNKYDYIIFIMATGIVVRSIASLVSSKFSDPAILVLDEQGNNVISLLSGHMGGANEMTLKVSHILNSNPVITTATDVNEKSALDMISKKLDGWIDNFRDTVKEINSMIVNNKLVGLYIDGDYEVDTRGFTVLDNSKSLYELLEKEEDKHSKLERIVVITNRRDVIYNKNTYINDSNEYTDNEKVDKYSNKIVKLTPKDIVVGIGCRKNIDSIQLRNNFIDFINRNNIDVKSIKKLGSIDIKRNEKAIIDLSKYLEVPFETISVEEISKVDYLFDKSEWVKQNVGVYSVAEPVAYILSDKNLVIQKQKYNGITFSIGREKL